MPKMWAIVPAFNEAERITATISSLIQIKDLAVMVVDDGSADNTSELAREAGANMVLTLPVNRGKGNALNQGVGQLPENAEIVAFIDADLGKCASEAEKLLMPVAEGKADMTIGIFPKATKKGGFGLVKRLARCSVKLLGGVEVTAPLSGQRALNRKALSAVFPLEEGYGIEVGLTIDAGRKGLRIHEVPVQMTHNETGRDLAGFKHRGKQFREILATDWHKLWHRR